MQLPAAKNAVTAQMGPMNEQQPPTRYLVPADGRWRTFFSGMPPNFLEDHADSHLFVNSDTTRVTQS